VDTGASVRNQYVTVDGHDVWAYVMPRELKLRLGLDLARALRELELAGVVHRDIKPANMLLHVGDAELKEGLLLKLMDFGEAAAADACSSREYLGVGGCPALRLSMRVVV
jgi:serine/threonine protein kinase